MGTIMFLQVPETPAMGLVQENRHHHKSLDEKAKEKLAGQDDHAWRDMSDHSKYGMKPAHQGPKKRKNFPWSSCVMHCMAGEGGSAAYSKSPERVEHPNAD